MPDPDKDDRPDPTEIARPFARIRVIAAIVAIAIAFGVLLWRSVIA